MARVRIAVFLFAAVVTSCAHDTSFWARVGDSPEGLSREEVTARLGEPTRIVESAEGLDTFWYENLYRKMYYGVDHYILLRDGKVVDHGSIRISDKFGDLRDGMSKDDVVRLVGEPSVEKTEGVREILIYLDCDYYKRFGASQPVDYQVALEDGRLVKKGSNYRRGFENPPSFKQEIDARFGSPYISPWGFLPWGFHR